MRKFENSIMKYLMMKVRDSDLSEMPTDLDLSKIIDSYVEHRIRVDGIANIADDGGFDRKFLIKEVGRYRDWLIENPQAIGVGRIR